ncbi:hypothetical protein ABZS66_12870 [Dactylosporangium sp. NPDC005572]|uniref:hypothetical protein n=1 Tax=Dactylosporangium sp. NPDC005572 TaxID=3156889 RepID=UPI00339F936F
MPAESDSSGTAAEETSEETLPPPANPLEALRRAQAARSLPPGSGGHGGKGGRGGGKGGNPKAPRMYNRGK